MRFPKEKDAEMQPLISVIIPLYKGEKYIVKCLDSVIKQQYVSVEIIVVNDAASDNSEEIVREYGEKNSILVNIVTDSSMESCEDTIADDFIKIVLINQGQGGAGYTGVKKAAGKYLAFGD